MHVVSILLYYARPGALWLLGMLFLFPAIAFAINGVWNLQYLSSATKRAAGKTGSASAVGMVMVVALSFAVFFPAIWTGTRIARHMAGEQADLLALAGATAVQYLVDFLLLLAMTHLFKNFEVSRDSQ